MMENKTKIDLKNKSIFISSRLGGCFIPQEWEG